MRRHNKNTADKIVKFVKFNDMEFHALVEEIE